MEKWNIIPTQNYGRDHREYEKKRPNELVAVINNLDTYVGTLNGGVHPLQIKDGFIHDEPEGIKALDQKGGGQKVKLEQTRLYIYPKVEACQLWLLAIGSKTNQKRDVRNCIDIVRVIKESK